MNRMIPTGEITAIINSSNTISKREFVGQTVRQVLFELMQDYGRVVKTSIIGGVPVWQFRKDVWVTLTGSVTIKVGYRTYA